jgi:hypothetical protein
MGRRPKLYLPLVVGFLDDDRIAVAGDGPTLLYLAICLKVKALGTDGRLSEVQIRRLNRPKWKVELATLAELQLVLWDDEAGQWFIAGWFGHNDAISQVEERRAADRERKRAEAAQKRLDSARNPSGFQSESGSNPADSLLSREKRSREKEREGNPRGVHVFVDDGQGCCDVAGCGTLPTNSIHLRAV